MIKVPYIMEALDILSNKTSSNKDAAKRDALDGLLQACFHINRQLLTWHQRLRYEFNGELFKVVPAVAHNPADDDIHGQVFPLAFEFPMLSVAQLVVLYWTTTLLLYRTIKDIQKLLERYDGGAVPKMPDQDPTAALKLSCPAEVCLSRETSHGGLPVSELPSPSYGESMSLLAANICQSVEYCYRSSNGTLGIQSTIFTIWAAESFYASQPALTRERKWCSEIGNMMAPNSRFDMTVMKFKNEA